MVPASGSRLAGSGPWHPLHAFCHAPRPCGVLCAAQIKDIRHLLFRFDVFPGIFAALLK